MKFYTIEFFFTNLDNSLYTDEEAAFIMQVRAGDDAHARLLAEHLNKKFEADYFLVR